MQGCNFRNYSVICIHLFLMCTMVFAGHIAFWSQTSPEYIPPSTDIRDNVAKWPPDIANNLTYYINMTSPQNMADRLRSTINHAMVVWESAANIKFVPVSQPKQARIIIYVEYNAKSDHYHGRGNAWPPVRRSDGSFKTSIINLYYGGIPDYAKSPYEDSWVWLAVHELGHALGLWHEFERSDRDMYMKVVPEQDLLYRYAHGKDFTAGTTFDYASVMMYGWTDNDREPYYFFAAPSEVPLPLPTVNYYQRNGLSHGDVEAIQWLYGKPQTSQPPIIHREPIRNNTLLDTLQQQGWKVVNAPGVDIYADEEGVAMESEYGLWDHWHWGGNPPRLEKTLSQSDFELSVDIKADYIPPGTHAGIVVIFGNNDWIYFGPLENPCAIHAQRTGRNLSAQFKSNSNFYQLIVRNQNRRLRLLCIQDGQEYEIESYSGLPRAVNIGIGMKSWGVGEFRHQLIHFQNLSLSTL